MSRIAVLSLLTLLTAVGCRTFSWKEGPSRRTGAGAGQDGIHDRLIAIAEDLLADSEERPEYGGADLYRMLDELGAAGAWRSGQGVRRLVEIAKRRHAYRAEGNPKPGDIVLFHNQWDANSNGEMDDWLTGAGVVVKSTGGRFEVVTRTGHAPRRIRVCPDTPSQHSVGGEVVNSFARVPRKSDPKDAVYLAGQLYAGFIDIEEWIED